MCRARRYGDVSTTVGTLFRWQRAEPATKSSCLPLSELRQRDIDVTNVDVDHRLAGLERGIARYVAGGFAVANEIEPIRPDLVGLHAHKQVKERTSFRIVTGADSWCEPCNRGPP